MRYYEVQEVGKLRQGEVVAATNVGLRLLLQVLDVCFARSVGARLSLRVHAVFTKSRLAINVRIAGRGRCTG